MIWIIGGTSEARELVEKIEDLSYIITLATESGEEFFQGFNYQVGRLDPQQMKEFCLENDIKCIVDISHPYAKVVSKEARKVADRLKLEYLRFLRDESKNSQEHIYLDSYEEAYSYLQSLEARVFITTGSKNIRDFEKIKGKNRFIYRILPSKESMELASGAGVSMANLVAMLGPFSKDLNIALFNEYKVDYCLMKDSGIRGGTQEKLDACIQLGIKALVIKRDPEEGIDNLDLLVSLVRKRSQQWKK